MLFLIAVELDKTAPRRILSQGQGRPPLSSAAAGRVKGGNAKKPAKGVALNKLILVKQSKKG